MKISRFFLSIIALQTAAFVAQSSANHGKSEFSRSKRVAEANNNMCSTNQLKALVPDGAILKSPKEGKSTVASGTKAEFVCKSGFQTFGQLKSFVCEEDGKWKETTPKQSGFCAKSGPTYCGQATIDVTGQATGILTSAQIEQHSSDAPVNCMWKLVTKDQGFYIKLHFVEFSLSPDCANNYISLENVNFTDPDRTKKCCNDLEGVCKFDGNTSPPLSRSVSQTLTVDFYSKTPKNSHFKAMWYNVNGKFPNGLIPSNDAKYESKIVVLQKQEHTEALGETPSILALTIFALIVFAIGAVLACKIGKHYLGPSCSFRHFREWASSRWSSRAPSSPRHRQDAPQEERGLMTDTDSPFMSGRVQIRQADRLRHEDESESSSVDSSLMVA